MRKGPSDFRRTPLRAPRPRDHHGPVNEPKQPSATSPSPDRPEWDRYSGVLRTFVMLNALLAFALEMAMLVFVAWWALELDLDGWWARLIVAVAAVGGLVVLWGAFASPKARLPLPIWGSLAVKAVAFGAGTTALWGLGLPAAAIAFAVVAIANTAVAAYVGRPR
jgi:hypothetical protein